MAVCSAMAVVVAFGVVGLRRVDEGQSGSPEMSSVACSSEIKEDGLRFVLRGKNEGYLRRELIYKVINLVQIYF